MSWNMAGTGVVAKFHAECAWDAFFACFFGGGEEGEGFAFHCCCVDVVAYFAGEVRERYGVLDKRHLPGGISTLVHLRSLSVYSDEYLSSAWCARRSSGIVRMKK